MKPVIALLLLAWVIPLPAAAQDLATLEQMRKAAASGNQAAQLELGILYEFGYNMPKNDVNALAWYTVSAERGNALASKRRDILKAKMSPDDVAAATKLSKELVDSNSTPSTGPEAPVAPAPPPPELKSPAPSIPPAERPLGPPNV